MEMSMLLCMNLLVSISSSVRMYEYGEYNRMSNSSDNREVAMQIAKYNKPTGLLYGLVWTSNEFFEP